MDYKLCYSPVHFPLLSLLLHPPPSSSPSPSPLSPDPEEGEEGIKIAFGILGFLTCHYISMSPFSTVDTAWQLVHSCKESLAGRLGFLVIFLILL